MKVVVTHQDASNDAVEIKGKSYRLGSELEVTEAEAKALEDMPGVKVSKDSSK